MNNPKYSVVIPVYNRPDEVKELLESLLLQTQKNFEVIVVDDGSASPCEEVVKAFFELLSIRYYFKPNSGPGPSRNFGFEHAKGDYYIVFDSDCILPPGFFSSVEQGLKHTAFDAWGGPDKAHDKFTIVQRATGYTMSSVLTTGGIRGGKKRAGWFQPRSFNMGITREVFQVTGGFLLDRFAEDIELSIRIKKAGFRIGLIQEAFVYHKRRTNFFQFFQQVFNFGKGRAQIASLHPEEVKITHWLPSFFTLGTFLIPLFYLLSVSLFKLLTGLLIFYLLLIFIHALMLTSNLFVACLSVPSALLQLWGYGSGFLIGKIKGMKSKQ